MRIGIITGEYPPMQGGVGAYSQILAQHFARTGHHVFIFSHETAAEAEDTLTLTCTNSWGPGVLRQARRWARQYDLDVINLQFETAAFGMSPWIHFIPNALRKWPVVTTFHDLLPPYLFPKAGRVREWTVLRLARSSAAVIATNHEDHARLAHLPRTALIPIGSNVTPELPPDFDVGVWRKKAGAEVGDFLLAHFGFVNRSKGIETLLRTLSILRADGFPARLVMIGGRTGTSDPTNAAYNDEIDTLIRHLNLDDVIHWTGFVDDRHVSAYLTAADAVVLPFRDGASYRRGSLMAAIRHGCAIITTQPAVSVPAFRHGENMLLFPPGDIEALTQCIRELAAGLYPGLGAGAAALSSQFDWNQIAADCVDLFEQVTRKQGRS